ncbi:hypothetical protein [Intestinimonas butyriciproducens]|uniref:hypothetical protein n=1 Tax=Intestinimonas butyriciproducens TaxID=1297617 RepID=UPI00242FC68D|nr:hypothetical protein [Intestinimonas butyriciproducens]MCI6362891.1 hypothetical protein [Intestinimonas butyriciproducens]
MADIRGLLASKRASDKQWQEQRQAERENIDTMRDAGITDVTSTPAAYLSYLDLQAVNPDYSAGNVVLAMYQLPSVMDEPAQIGTAERWQGLGRSVIPAERGHGAKIFVRPKDPKRRGYDIGEAFTLDQTQGRTLREFRLAEDTHQMEKALATLMNYAPGGSIRAVEGQEAPAVYDERNMEITIDPDAPEGELFAALAVELVHARAHNQGRNPYYRREDTQLDAESVSYLLCKRFGIDREPPDAAQVSSAFLDWSTEDRAEALKAVQETAKKIGGNIERSIEPPGRDRGRSYAPADRRGR